LNQAPSFWFSFSDIQGNLDLSGMEVQSVEQFISESPTVGDYVSLSEGYLSFANAANGPLQPGDVCRVIQDDGTDGESLLVEVRARKWWYARGALRLSTGRQETSREVPLDTALAVGDHVTVTPDFEDHADACVGPLKPGLVGRIVEVHAGQRPFVVEYSGSRWRYERLALCLSSPAPEVPSQPPLEVGDAVVLSPCYEEYETACLGPMKPGGVGQVLEINSDGEYRVMVDGEDWWYPRGALFLLGEEGPEDTPVPPTPTDEVAASSELITTTPMASTDPPPTEPMAAPRPDLNLQQSPTTATCVTDTDCDEVTPVPPTPTGEVVASAEPITTTPMASTDPPTEPMAAPRPDLNLQQSPTTPTCVADTDCDEGSAASPTQFDAVELSPSYRAKGGAPDGPLKPGEIGQVLEDTGSGDKPLKVMCDNEVGWYAREDLCLVGGADPETSTPDVPALPTPSAELRTISEATTRAPTESTVSTAVPCSDRQHPESPAASACRADADREQEPAPTTRSVRSTVAVGDTVVLSRDFESFETAVHGPMQPGDVGTVVEDEGAGDVRVEFDGQDWWYPLGALRAPGAQPEVPPAATQPTPQPPRRLVMGDTVVLRPGYVGLDAAVGPLKPGDVGQIVEDDWSWIPYKVLFANREHWYTQEALCLFGESEVPATAPATVLPMPPPSSNRLNVGDAVVLSPHYQSCHDAANGPLQPGDVGQIIEQDETLMPHRVFFAGREHWYTADALRLFGEAGPEVPAPAPPIAAQPAPRVGPGIGDAVVLSPGYLVCDDAAKGPMKPGDVGQIMEDDGSGKPLKVIFEGNGWWYTREALVVFGDSCSEAIPPTAAQTAPPSVAPASAESATLAAADCARQTLSPRAEKKREPTVEHSTGEPELMPTATDDQVPTGMPSNTALPSPTVDDAVMLSPAYCTCEDAAGGPMQPGQVGQILEDTGLGAKPLKVMCDGQEWWYSRAALCLLDEAGPQAVSELKPLRQQTASPVGCFSRLVTMLSGTKEQKCLLRWEAQEKKFPLGVSVNYLNSEFKHYLSTDYAQYAKQSLAELGNRIWGPPSHPNVKPLNFLQHASWNDPSDGRRGVSLCHAIGIADAESIGKATLFVSVVASFPIFEVIDALYQHCTDNKLNPAKTFVWMSFFCSNHRKCTAPAGVTDRVAECRKTLSKIQKMVCVLDDFHKPTNMKRAWPVYEVFVASELNLKPSVALLSEARRRFGTSQLQGMFLADVDAMEARATVSDDEESIKKEFRKARGGPTNVNVEVHKLVQNELSRLLRSTVLV